MISNHLPLSLLLAISLPVGLVGCQSPTSKHSTLTNNSVSTAPVITQDALQNEAPTAKQETRVIDTEAAEVPSETATEANTLQWASNYHWQLTQVKDLKDKIININTDPLITLEVAPSSLSLSQGCQHFTINFRWIQAPPFEYGSVLNERPSDCKNAPENKTSETNIKALFPDDDTLKLDAELLPLAKNLLVNTQLAPKNLVIKIENGNTLMFDGTLKVFKNSTGLPIDKALLERYDWKLKSAVRNTFDDKGKIISRQSIGNFYHPEFPVSLRFRGYEDSQYAFFSSTCNGIGGPYILTPDNMLLIGSGPQSMMGCGPKREAAEDKIRELEQLSKSQLTLQQLSNTNVDDPILPYYLLTQKLDTGEILIWKNKKTVTR